jgi:hypothetical protein
LFDKCAKLEKKPLNENAWNTNEKIMYNGMMVKKDYFQEALIATAKDRTVDENRLKLVADECLQLISFIGSKIEKVEITRYEEKEFKEEWEYIEFGANKYQTDLFFIRNSSRIKLIFNVIKKNSENKTRNRCMLAKLAMTRTYEVKKRKKKMKYTNPICISKKQSRQNIKNMQKNMHQWMDT